MEESAGTTMSKTEPRSLMMELWLTEVDLLLYLDHHGATSLRHVTRHLDHPMPLVMMAVGSLLRSGRLRVRRHELEMIVERVTRPSEQPAAREDASSDAWSD